MMTNTFFTYNDISLQNLFYSKDVLKMTTVEYKLLSANVDKLALTECVEVIKANVKDVITNKANKKEKKWWIDGNYKIINEDR